MKIMIEMDSLQELQKVMHNSPDSSISTEQLVAKPNDNAAQNAGSCASINLNKDNNVSQTALFADDNGKLSYGQPPLEHKDFANVNTAGRYEDKTVIDNPSRDFSNFSQPQVTTLAIEPTTNLADEDVVRNAGDCFQTGFNPN